MNRNDALEYVSFVVDDAGCGRRLHGDQHAIAREESYRHPSVLVGWQCGFEPMFVAVHSYLDVAITDADAEEIAQEYLAELGWFSDGITDADYIIGGA
jgi:hypothetical protein